MAFMKASCFSRSSFLSISRQNLTHLPVRNDRVSVFVDQRGEYFSQSCLKCARAPRVVLRFLFDVWN